MSTIGRTFQTTILLGSLLAGGAMPASAQDYGASGVELAINGSLFSPGGPSFTPAEAGFDLSTGVSLGGRLGYVFPFQLFVQANLAYAPSTLTRAGGAELSLSSLMYDGSVGYNFQLSRAVQLFVAGGAGAISWSPEGLPSEADFAIHFGAGARAFLNQRLAIRADFRNRYAPDGLSATRRQLEPGLGLEVSRTSTNSLELSLGISYFLSVGVGDADGDGVKDDRDLCGSTPVGSRVDTVGCAIDSDDDGVADFGDRCPQTPEGARVDAAGCPVDEDSDGVPDGLDRCTGTPSGVQVDADGCPVDADSDGVVDGIDQCPGTAAGVLVDGSGCPVDTDGDGVADGLDRCPGTPAGSSVGSDGCEVSAIETALLDTGRAIVEGVNFDQNSARIRPVSISILNEIGQVLVKHTDLRIEIQGHTDATGSAAENLRLSQLRAEAMLDYLTTNFRGLDPTRLTARGYGESRPIASNQTVEGQQRNRRVELVVIRP